MSQAAEANRSTPPGTPLDRGILAERGWALILSLLLIPAILGTNLIYDSLNHGPNRIFLETPVDRALPVVPIFAIPYVSLIPYIGVSLLVFLFFRVRVYRSAAITIIVVWFISYACYFFLQSYIARPQITGVDPFSAMIRTIYASDQPYNDFPSLHTSLICGDRKSTRLNSSHTKIYPLSLHDALPISADHRRRPVLGNDPDHLRIRPAIQRFSEPAHVADLRRSEEHTSELQSHQDLPSFPPRRSSDLRRSPASTRSRQ